MSDTPSIGLGFARRQTPESRFSHWTCSDEHLVVLAQHQFVNANPTYRKYDETTGVDKNGLWFGGVISVPVAMDMLHYFMSGICQLQEGDRLTGRFEPRRPGEKPRKSTQVVGGQKMPARSAQIILYHRDVLAEDSEHEGNLSFEWEIVAVNASPTGEEPPINPGTLLHNHFLSSGGTSTGMTDAELVAKLRESWEWWADKALAAEKDNQ